MSIHVVINAHVGTVEKSNIQRSGTCQFRGENRVFTVGCETAMVFVGSDVTSGVTGVGSLFPLPRATSPTSPFTEAL